MKDSVSKGLDSAAAGFSNEHARRGGVLNVGIAILKGHVRRASRAADGVYAAAQRADGIENGVVFMTAILLVERLASASNSDPRAVIAKMVRCFDIKAGFTRSSARDN